MKNNPDISIIICSYNREKFLPVSLKALTKQTLPPNKFEVIIINNNSTDNTEAVSKNFISAHQNLNVKYFLEAQRGLSAARNRGIKESLGEIIVFIDDDAEVIENYLETVLHFFNNYSDTFAVGGKIIPLYETGNEPDWLSKPLWGLVTKADWGNKINKYPTGTRPYGCNMAFRKSLFEEIGLFNTDLLFRSEDKYIFIEMLKHGRKFLYHPELKVFHHIDNKRVSRESFIKMSLSIGGGERDRLQNAGLITNLIKVAEYIFKYFAAVIISISFLFKLEFKKAKYVLDYRWLILKGYFLRAH